MTVVANTHTDLINKVKVSTFTPVCQWDDSGVTCRMWMATSGDMRGDATMIARNGQEVVSTLLMSAYGFRDPEDEFRKTMKKVASSVRLVSSFIGPDDPIAVPPLQEM